MGFGRRPLRGGRESWQGLDVPGLRAAVAVSHLVQAFSADVDFEPFYSDRSNGMFMAVSHLFYRNF